MDPIHTDVVVIGAGPGGYAAAFYAADLGKKVILVEQEKTLGGVCLNRGCIPSKALIHATNVISEAKHAAHHGLTFAAPSIDVTKLRAWKDSIVTKLSQGVAGLAKARGVQVIHGRAHFESSTTIRIETEQGQQFVQFEKAIVATGSRPAMPKAFDLGNPRVMTSTEALQVEEIPAKLLVIGGGYIGMELGLVYATLGSEVVVAEAMDSILMGADPDLVRPVQKAAEKAVKEFRFKAKVTKMATVGKQIKVAMEHNGQTLEELYDRVLVSVGRAPNSDNLGLENTGVKLDEKGFIKVNSRQQTDDPAICAIGDIAGGILLAHKASKEARIAVENLFGDDAEFKDIVIPAVVFTEPEVAWAGLTETEAKAKNIEVKVARFPWGASGRALTFDKTDGVTKLIVDPKTERVLGVGIVGHGAGELIAEAVVAIEMGATVTDLALCVHPHPTLSETIMEAAEVFLGHATHFAPPKRVAAAH
jgi:dihydrolipoamide dehydrogenase